MYGNEGIVIVRHGDCRLSRPVHSELPSALSPRVAAWRSVVVTRDDVTVLPGRQRRLERVREPSVLVVDDKEPTTSTSKGDPIPAVVPPVGHGVAQCHVVEPDHVVDLTPTVLAHPLSVEADDVLGGPWWTRWRSHPLIAVVASIEVLLPVEAAHDPHVTVLPGQLEGIGDLVHARLTECEDAVEVTGALRVVVVDEDKGVERVQLNTARSYLLLADQ